MKHQDLVDFANAWISASEILRGQPPTDRAVKMAFELLKEHDLSIVLNALTDHMQKNKWFPAPSEIIDLIVGVIPDDDVLLGLASVNYESPATGNPDTPDTPLGVIVRMEINRLGWNYRQLDLRELKQAVRGARPAIERFVENARVGKFEDRHMGAMVRSGFEFKTPICEGYLPAPLTDTWEVIDADKTRRELAQSRQIEIEKEQKRLLELAEVEGL